MRSRDFHGRDEWRSAFDEAGGRRIFGVIILIQHRIGKRIVGEVDHNCQYSKE